MKKLAGFFNGKSCILFCYLLLCDMLTIFRFIYLIFSQGFNGQCLRITRRHRLECLLQRLPASAPAKDRVKAIVNSGIILGSIFHSIGHSCLVTDEMFQAPEFKELLTRHKRALAEYSVLEKKKRHEIQGKQILLKEELLSDDYRHLFRWKLGEAYSSTTTDLNCCGRFGKIQRLQTLSYHQLQQNHQFQHQITLLSVGL
jgi:hypothetical protein